MIFTFQFTPDTAHTILGRSEREVSVYDADTARAFCYYYEDIRRKTADPAHLTMIQNTCIKFYCHPIRKHAKIVEKAKTLLRTLKELFVLVALGEIFSILLKTIFLPQWTRHERNFQFNVTLTIFVLVGYHTKVSSPSTLDSHSSVFVRLSAPSRIMNQSSIFFDRTFIVHMQLRYQRALSAFFFSLLSLSLAAIQNQCVNSPWPWAYERCFAFFFLLRLLLGGFGSIFHSLPKKNIRTICDPRCCRTTRFFVCTFHSMPAALSRCALQPKGKYIPVAPEGWFPETLLSAVHFWFHWHCLTIDDKKKPKMLRGRAGKSGCWCFWCRTRDERERECVYKQAGPCAYSGSLKSAVRLDELSDLYCTARARRAALYRSEQKKNWPPLYSRCGVYIVHFSLLAPRTRQRH